MVAPNSQLVKMEITNGVFLITIMHIYWGVKTKYAPTCRNCNWSELIDLLLWDLFRYDPEKNDMRWNMKVWNCVLLGPDIIFLQQLSGMFQLFTTFCWDLLFNCSDFISKFIFFKLCTFQQSSGSFFSSQHSPAFLQEMHFSSFDCVCHLPACYHQLQHFYCIRNHKKKSTWIYGMLSVGELATPRDPQIIHKTVYSDQSTSRYITDDSLHAGRGRDPKQE